MALLGSSGFPVDEERDGDTEGEEKNWSSSRESWKKSNPNCQNLQIQSFSIDEL